MPSKGTVVESAEHATLTFRRTHRHAIERVWDAITTREGLSEWLMCSQVNIDPRVGGAIELVSGPARYHSTGTILVWDPPYVFEYEWNVAPVPEMPRGEQAVFRYELARRGEATDMVVTYVRITKQVARGFLPGLHAFLDRLEAQLDASPLPDWYARFEILQRDYDWSSHAPPAGQ